MNKLNTCMLRGALAALFCSMGQGAIGETRTTCVEICRGVPRSELASQGSWKSDSGKRVLVVSEESQAIFTSHTPGGNADFLLYLRLQIEDGSACRLRVGKSVFDLSRTDTTIKLLVNQESQKFEGTDDGSLSFVKFRLQQKSGQLSTDINDDKIVDVGLRPGDIEAISLQATAGTLGVDRLILSGVELVSRSNVE